MKIAAVILAAGEASRFGKPKQMLSLRGESLVSRSCRVAIEAGCSTVTVVLGAYSEEILKGEEFSSIRVLKNEHWERGMGESLALGVRAIGDDDWDGLVVMLADQVAVSVDSLKCVMEVFKEDREKIVISKNQEVSGPPTIFPYRFTEELMKLSGDVGAKHLIKNHAQDVIAVNHEESYWDIDTPDDWRRFLDRNGYT